MACSTWPIGGPPPFFVTGVAAGLGFNRKLVIPSVSGVANFPLVAWAQGIGTPSMDPDKPIGEQVGAVLASLAQSGVVAPSVGDYWLAAGIQFTSFELVTSFALLTVSLGTDVEIALLGLSTLSIPPDVAEPVAEVQLALEVAFSYDKGLLAVAGQLTPNSYVLSRSARLTGGFAFDLWFRGDHAGEFVLTLGGYNPSFTVPGYYPVVPRVGLTWQVVPRAQHHRRPVLRADVERGDGGRQARRGVAERPDLGVVHVLGRLPDDVPAVSLLRRRRHRSRRVVHRRSQAVQRVDDDPRRREPRAVGPGVRRPRCRRPVDHLVHDRVRREPAADRHVDPVAAVRREAAACAARVEQPRRYARGEPRPGRRRAYRRRPRRPRPWSRSTSRRA